MKLEERSRITFQDNKLILRINSAYARIHRRYILDRYPYRDNYLLLQR